MSIENTALNNGVSIEGFDEIPIQVLTLSNLSFHPVADLFPLMDEYETVAFKFDIREHGLQEPIYVDSQHRIIDGRHRFRACLELGYTTIPAKVVNWTEEAIKQFAFSENFNRRHLTTGQKAYVAARLKILWNTAPLSSALRLRISLRSIERALYVLTHGCAEIQSLAEKGVIATDLAAIFSSLPMEEQLEIAQQSLLSIREKVKEMRRSRRQMRDSDKLDAEQLLCRYGKRIDAEVKKIASLPPSIAEAISHRVLQSISTAHDAETNELHKVSEGA